MKEDKTLDLELPRMDKGRVYNSFRQFFNESLQSMDSVEGTNDLTNRWATLPVVRLPYDSTADTLQHIKRVNELLGKAAKELISRGAVHDNSKLLPPEKELFDEYTPKLKGTTYESEEYRDNLAGLMGALKHHYENNSHHPEHYPHGVLGMDLFDVVEMFFDWKAATERHADGDIFKSIDHNKGRFKTGDVLASVFKNTALRYNW